MERHAKFGLLAILIAIAVSEASPPSVSGRYRTDYEYNPKTLAFYKMHLDSAFMSMAKDICKQEGSQLLTAVSQQDVIQAHAMFKQYPDLGDYLLLGDDEQQHEFEEETPLIDLEPTSEEREMGYGKNCEMMDRRGEIISTHCYRSHPYICKVEAKDAPYDSRCDVYDSGYTYVESVGSCYKVSLTPMNWDGANAECSAVNAHLIVLNSEAEHLAMKTFLQTAPRLRNADVDYFYLAGMRRASGNDDFRTIFNQTLAEAGYAGWQEGEPNNWRNSELCGSLFRNNGMYNDVSCHGRFAFICEKEVPAQT